MPVSKRQLYSIIVVVILISAVGIGLYLVSQPQIFKPKAASDSTVDLKLLPQNITADLGSEFGIDVNIDSKTASVSAAQLKINFDSQFLEAKNIEIKDFLPVQLAPPKIATGSVSLIQAVNPQNTKFGVGTIARITFKALKIATGSAIFFDPAQTFVAILDRNDNSSGVLSNALVTISCPVLQAPVVNSLQNPQPGIQSISWSSVSGAVKYNVKIDDLKDSLDCAAGSSDLCQEITGTSLTALFKKGHKYEIKVQAQNSCARTSEAAAIVLFPFDGDILINGVVDIFDYNKVVADFNKPNSPADINKNGVVDIFDYNSVVRDFGKSFTNPGV